MARGVESGHKQNPIMVLAGEKGAFHATTRQGLAHRVVVEGGRWTGAIFFGVRPTQVRGGHRKTMAILLLELSARSRQALIDVEAEHEDSSDYGREAESHSPTFDDLHARLVLDLARNLGFLAGR